MESKIFKGKVAIVTGSAMGIGKAISNELVQAGASVVLNDKERELLHSTEHEFLDKGFDVEAIVADIRFPVLCQNLIQQTLRRFGKIDILVNNAGVSSRGAVEEMANTNIRTLIDTNYTGTTYLCKYAIPHLRKAKGSLIFINSVGGFRGMPYNSAYTASKVAQAALAEALRVELYDDGIHVGIAFLGYTENDPDKKILDTDGSWIYLPKRTNVSLATRESVAKRIISMIKSRSSKVTLSPLGKFTSFMTRYLPELSEWLLTINRDKIYREYTGIGGEKIVIKERDLSEKKTVAQTPT